MSIINKLNSEYEWLILNKVTEFRIKILIRIYHISLITYYNYNRNLLDKYDKSHHVLGIRFFTEFVLKLKFIILFYS